jgi:hypothetical protein
MRFMEHYDNNDSVTVMMVKSLNRWCWKWFGLFIWGDRSVSVVCLFIWYRNCKACKDKWWCLWTSEVCHNIKVCLLNVKDPKISHPKCFFISLHKITKMGKILTIFAIFWQAVVFNGAVMNRVIINILIYRLHYQTETLCYN